MERRARPRGRPDDRKRLDVVTADVLSSDDSDDSDLPGEHSNPDGEAVDDAANAAVVSRVHAGIASFTELYQGCGRVRCDRVVQMNVFGNRIATLDGLQRFTQLQELCLSNNRLEELSFHELDPLKLLRVLDLSANQLSTLRGLPLLPRLEELSIAHNRLTGLEGLLRPVKLPKLRYLDVRGNQLASPAVLVPLQHLKRLVHLRLQSRDGAVPNPVCDLEEYPEALLEFLPALKQLDEEEVALLRELSRVRMPKYRSAAARRFHSQSAGRADGTSQTTPDKPSATAAGHSMRVFAESRERVGYEVSRNESRNCSPRGRVDTDGENTKPVSTNGNGVPTAALPMRVVLREVSTNTEFNLEKAILDRETLLLEKQATSLVREQEILRRESEFLAKEKEQQETIRQLQGQLASALERIAKLEMQASQTTHEWEAKLQEVIHSREEDAKVEITQMTQLKQLQHEVERLQCINESLSAELSSKDNIIIQLKEDSSRIHLEEAASVQHARANITALEAALKEAEDRWRHQEGQLKSQQAVHAAQVETLSQQISRLDLDHKAQAKQIEEAEKRFHEMKTSRDHFREECLHKDDELYRLKKALLHKSEEVEEVRVQLMKAAERQDRMQQQQQQLYDKQLQANIVQLEMEFRREHHQATEKLQVAYRKYQETLRQLQRLKGSYESSLKREALLKEEVHRLSAIIEGDKEKLVDQELTKRAEYEFKIQRLQDKTRGLHDELVAAREETARVSALQHELGESRLEIDRLSGEMKRVEGVVQSFEVKEGDWKAALKVKDTMLNDQMRQLDELRNQLKTLEDEYQHDTGELETRIEDLEEALDESLEKISRLQEKYDRAKAALAENEGESTKHRVKMDDMAKEIELKNAALELIEGEMSRMRDTLSKQDGIFQKRLQRHLEQHREEMERTRVSVEETNTKLRVKLEEEQAAMTQKYNKLADDLKDIAAQNTKLRVTLDQERKKNLQSDREMRVLLAQLDRERHIKNERLGDIKRLFEQLQQETP